MPKFKLPVDTDGIRQTGERFHVGQRGEIEFEHYHRYLFAAQFCKDRDVLDVASGEGYGGFLLSQVARSVVGVDIDNAVVEYAGKTYGSDKLRFAHGSCLKLPASDRSFDVVVSFETLEHIREHDQFLEEVHRVLRPDGVLIISTPDRNVYSNPDMPNPFHVLELTKSEFQKALSQQYSIIEMGVQKTTAGSVILPDRRGKVAMQVFHEDARIFAPSHSLRSAPFLLAIASNVEVPPIQWGILDCSAFIGEQRREIEQRDLNVEQLVGQIRDRDGHIFAADGEIRRLIAEINERDQRLVAGNEELRRVGAKADSDLRIAINEIENRDRQLAAADGEERRLTAEVVDRDQKLVSLGEALQRMAAKTDSDLRRAIGEIQERERRLVAADGEARRLTAEVVDRDQKLMGLGEALHRMAAETDSDLRRAVGEIQERERQLVAADGEARRLTAELVDRDQKLADLGDELQRMATRASDRDQKLIGAGEELQRMTAHAERELRRTFGEIQERDRQLGQVKLALSDAIEGVEARDRRLFKLECRIHKIEMSATWRITAPMRKLFVIWRDALSRLKKPPS
jgi:SAM-dependent methyltransferase